MSCCSNKKTAFSIIEPIGGEKKIFLDRLKPYHPLLVMAFVMFLGSVTLSYGLQQSWMPIFMGLFLLNFSMFKLFDIEGFAKNFALYDIIGQRSSLYAKAYPFIELALAIGFLSNRHPVSVNALTAIVMTVGLIGVLNKRKSDIQIRCACMGNLINVPVGTVTILENTSMILMSLIMLFHSL